MHPNLKHRDEELYDLCFKTYLLTKHQSTAFRRFRVVLGMIRQEALSEKTVVFSPCTE